LMFIVGIYADKTGWETATVLSIVVGTLLTLNRGRIGVQSPIRMTFTHASKGIRYSLPIANRFSLQKGSTGADIGLLSVSYRRTK